LTTDVIAPLEAASMSEPLPAGAGDARAAESTTPKGAQASDAADTPSVPTVPPPGAPPNGKSVAFWNSWSNRRLFSVGAVAIGIAIVVSLLLRGLLTPAANTTPNLHAKPQPPDPLINHYAPATTMVDLSGNPVTLASLKGKIVVLNFWYAACQPCRYEMPALEKAYLKYRAQGVVIVGIDPVDDAQTASNFVHTVGVTYPITLDKNLATVQTYKVFDTPTTFFIDRQGVIRYKSIGALNTTTLNTDLTALLAVK